MEEFKQLEIYLFPIVMLLAIGMNNWKREERTQGDRIFGFLPFLIICMMGSDVTYHALQLYVHRFTVLYAGYLVYCFFLTAVPYAWLLYVNGKLSVRHNRRWTAAVCHVMTGTAIAVVLLTVIIPWSLSTMGRACGVLQLKSRQSAGKAGKYCDVSDGTYSDSDGVSEGGYQGRAERDALSA